MADVKIELDMKSCEHACYHADGLKPILQKASNTIAARSTALGSGYRTPKWHDHDTGETKGGKAPKYGADVYHGKRGYIGIVHPENYSAMKDNYLHNTMLKAI